jgi:hypothetical protein|tara:strand:+ start:365 stop:517 length:153 start_codon:yes stop_codon:yes gene_type:complete
VKVGVGVTVKVIGIGVRVRVTARLIVGAREDAGLEVVAGGGATVADPQPR